MANSLLITGASQLLTLRGRGQRRGAALAKLGIVRDGAVLVRDGLIAAVGDALLKLEFSGHQTRELSGQRDLTYAEVAKIAGKAIGKPDLTYVQLPTEQVMQALQQMGMSKNVATLLCEMCEAMNNGHMCALEARSARNTTPTSYEEFVQKAFVPAYKGQATSA